MVGRLFQSLQKPSLWQRSAEPFWDDEHISKGMLEAHLNPDWDAASRKHSFIDLSVKWISNIIPAGGKILDLGCGPGLYTKRLSDMGYDVTGMDYSRRSIAYAKGQVPHPSDDGKNTGAEDTYSFSCGTRAKSGSF